MLANERLIIKMSLEQKVKFVTSLNAYESSPVGGYEFPVFKLKGQPYDDCPDVYATCFPSDKALASTWNSTLISDVYGAIGDETKSVHSFGYFNNTDDCAIENLSSDNFVTAKFILSRTLGLSLSNQAVNFEKTYTENSEREYDKMFITNTVLADAKPTSILVKNPSDVESITKKFKYNNLFFGIASSPLETVRLLLAGCSLVFISEDFLTELVGFLSVRTEEYRKAYRHYRSGQMKLGEFDRLVRNLEIFDETIIDEACDKLISILFEMKENGEKVHEMEGLDGKNNAKFDEISHDELALRAARESVVLIKNDGILPLTYRTRIAVAGEYANDFSYQKELFGCNPTVEMLPFDVINEYEELNTTGYVAGYAKGVSGRVDLIDSAVGLAEQSDCTLLYLCAGRGQASLPPEQTELIEALSSKGVGIIAVVACDENIDLSFADKCKAVLLTYNGGQEGTAAVLDILCGIVSPSGKLVKEVLKPDGEVMYPFGYGLSYTKFAYSKLKVKTNGVSFTIANTGECDGFASVQLYVKKKDAEGIFSNKTLRGFAKAYVKKGDAVNVEIAFDENTFRSFSDEKNCYAIDGGNYEITISENYTCDKLVKTVTLGGRIFNKTPQNEIAETSNGADVKEKKARTQDGVKLSFSVKLFLGLMLGLYYNGLIAVFAFTPIISVKGFILYVILGSIAAVLNILLIVYIVLIAKQRKKQLKLHTNDVLTDMVDKIKDFKEIAKVSYAVPVKEEENGEENGEGETNGENAVFSAEEPVERTFDASLDDSEKEATFTEHISLAEVCSNFREFALSYGVNIEIISVRAIISAVASSKIVILKSANTEVLPDLLKALCAYFGSTAITNAKDDWKKAGDLMWKEAGDRYVVSDFTNAVHGASKSPAKMCVAILENVNAENVMSYFSDFVDYANHPTEEHEMKISDELIIKLSDNITYFVVPEEGSTQNFSKEFINASMTVDLALSRAEKGSEVEVKSVAFAEFNDLVKAAREDVFISEKIWKKVDELFGTISASEKFSIGNKNTLQTEKLTSVIMECGGDEAEAFTQMFVCKLVPLLKNTRLYKQDGGDRTLSGIIEKLFPEEDLAKIQKALVKLN